MPAPSTPNRIAIDVTHTIASGLHSGVQRVVRNLAANLSQHTMPVQTVMHDGQYFRCVHLQEVDRAFRNLNQIRSDVVEHLPQTYRKGVERACRCLPFRSVRDALLPSPGRQGIYRSFIKMSARRVAKQVMGAKLDLRANDVLILPDAYWAYSQIWPSVRECRLRGAFVAAVVYDLIPLTHPQFVVQGADRGFREYLQAMALTADLVLAISDTVKQQVAEMLPQLWPDDELCQDIQAFELGAELLNSEGPIRQEIQKLFETEDHPPPYLMVATLEPRKNHAYVLDALEQVWQRDPSVSILLVGRVGWLCDEILKRVQEHPRFRRQLHLMHGVSDAELCHCYQHARAVILASITEGCGLPIVEARWYGTQVLASDTPIHREVGKQDCRYFDLRNPQSLAELLLNWEQEVKATGEQVKLPQRPVSWSESSEQFLQRCLQSFAQHRARMSGRKSKELLSTPTDLQPLPENPLRKVG